MTIERAIEILNEIRYGDIGDWRLGKGGHVWYENGSRSHIARIRGGDAVAIARDYERDAATPTPDPQVSQCPGQ